MKAMQKDLSAADKARKSDRGDDSGLMTIKPMKLDAGKPKAGFKKGGFKSAFGAPADNASDNNAQSTTGARPGFKKIGQPAESNVENQPTMVDEESDDDSVPYAYYDPRKPTGCAGDCEQMR